MDQEKLNLAPVEETKQEPINPTKYREHMKSVIAMIKLEHEYTKLNSEIAMYELQRLQALEALSAYKMPRPSEASVEAKESVETAE